MPPDAREKAGRWVDVCGGVEDGWVRSVYYGVAMSTTGSQIQIPTKTRWFI